MRMSDDSKALLLGLLALVFFPVTICVGILVGLVGLCLKIGDALLELWREFLELVREGQRG